MNSVVLLPALLALPLADLVADAALVVLLLLLPLLLLSLQPLVPLLPPTLRLLVLVLLLMGWDSMGFQWDSIQKNRGAEPAGSTSGWSNSSHGI